MTTVATFEIPPLSQVAPLVAFLASDDAAVITGSIYAVDAGAALV